MAGNGLSDSCWECVAAARTRHLGTGITPTLKKRIQGLRFVYAPAFLCCCFGAHADSFDTVNVRASYSLQADSNIFRLPESAPGPQGTSTKDERIETSGLGLSVDKKYSLQRFLVNIDALDYRYHNFSYLGFDTLNHDASWLWSVTPRVHGSLSTQRNTTLNSYTDFSNVNVRNLRTSSSTGFSAEGELSAAWRLFGSVSASRLTNDLPVVQDGDTSLKNAVLGLRYVLPSNSSFSYRFRRGTGEYFNRNAAVTAVLPTDLRETEHEFRFQWALTGKTTVQARLAHLSRTHPDVPLRDFGGTVGNMGLDWSPTSKIRVAAFLARELNVYQTNTASYTVIDQVTVAPTWKLTAHTTLKANYQFSSQDFRGPLPGLDLTDPRRDRTSSIQVGADWSPRESVVLSVALQNTRRASNVTGFSYRVNTATLGAKLNF